jgi:DNA polymerase III subunit alpha
VVIGDKPLVEYLPLYRGKKRSGDPVRHEARREDRAGEVRLPGAAQPDGHPKHPRLIRDQQQEPPDLANLTLDDPATYRLLCAGDTTGVFQLESSGMKDLLVRLKPESLSDIVALVALYRPGPMESGMIDDYVERKHGRKRVSYLHPSWSRSCEETYGVIVYQEQVMKIASELASYSMAEADGLRKAMGKKIAAIMAQQRERFMKGAVEKGVPADTAKEPFSTSWKNSAATASTSPTAPPMP